MQTIEANRAAEMQELLPGWMPRDSGQANGHASYAMGYSDVFLDLLRSRDAHRNAAHLLPSLRPGMDLLDLGCGPGSITAGLAEAVMPGRVIALDRDPAQLEMTSIHAAMSGLDNIETKQGNALELPFGAESFDAVHCHGFLMHSPDVRRQLREIRRVLRPGGIASAREMDVSSSFISPAAHSHEIFGMLADVVRLEHGDPLRGRHLKSLFAAAGFRDVRAGYSADFFDQPRETEFPRRFPLHLGAVE